MWKGFKDLKLVAPIVKFKEGDTKCLLGNLHCWDILFLQKFLSLTNSPPISTYSLHGGHKEHLVTISFHILEGYIKPYLGCVLTKINNSS